MKRVLKDLACHKNELSILFTDDTHIEEMNRRYLGREGPTNVMAFPMSDVSISDVETGMLGDVVISVDTAIRESERDKEPLDITIYRLLIHGILHLLDFDHERSPEDEKEMMKQERRLLSMIREEC
jgi:probable rRNA maturation factor